MNKYGVVFIITIIILSFSSCSKSSALISVNGIKISQTSLSIIEGSSVTLTASVFPADASNKTVEWQSSDNSIAIVNSGIVTAIKPGTVNITAISVDGGFKATCSVTVKSNHVPVSEVSLDKNQVDIFVGESVSIIATVLPENASNKTVSWSSSDNKIVAVVDGLISAVNKGRAVVTVKTEEGGFTASCEFNVREKQVIKGDDNEGFNFENWE